MKIQNIMTVPVRTCATGDSLNQAAQTMWEADIGSLPVLDHESRLVGMITDRDLVMAAHLRGAPLWALHVSDAMAKVIYAAKTSDKLRDAARLMITHQLRRLPVVDQEGRLAGILTLGDFARTAESKNKKGLTAKEVSAVLAAVSSPRPSTSNGTLVIEVTRASEPAPQKNVIQPAPRKAKRAEPAARAKKSKSAR